jgi:glycerol-3-phosphate acyltransferase PlsY
MEHVLVLVLAYLVGSVPFAYLLSRRRGIDLRAVGSGNVGASNVLRTSGVGTAVLAMLLDALKGVLAVVVAQRLAPGTATPMAAGLVSVLGHVYPIWLRFRGGKGVATAAGVFGVMTPGVLAIACGVFLLAVWTTRFISVGSIAAAITIAIATAVTDAPAVVSVGALMIAALIVSRHRANLRRLRTGTERRVGQRLSRATPALAAGDDDGRRDHACERLSNDDAHPSAGPRRDR